MSNESVYRAIADPTRRRIIDQLRTQESTPGDLAQTLRVKNEALSFHLRVLLATGVVSQRRRGRNRVYRLNANVFTAVLQWLRADGARS